MTPPWGTPVLPDAFSMAVRRGMASAPSTRCAPVANSRPCRTVSKPPLDNRLSDPLDRAMSRPLGPIRKRSRLETRLEDGFEHELERTLCHPVPDRRHRQDADFAPIFRRARSVRLAAAQAEPLRLVPRWPRRQPRPHRQAATLAQARVGRPARCSAPSEPVTWRRCRGMWRQRPWFSLNGKAGSEVREGNPLRRPAPQHQSPDPCTMLPGAAMAPLARATRIMVQRCGGRVGRAVVSLRGHAEK